MSALMEAIRRSHDPDGPVGDDSPMRVLGRRRLSGAEVIAQSVATTAPAASMVIVPTMLLTHNDAVSGVLLLGGVLALMVATAVCLSQFTRRMVSPGGLYSFVFQGLGRRPALLGGAAIALKYIASSTLTLYHGTLAVTALLSACGLDADASTVKTLVFLTILAAMGVSLVRGVRLTAIVILAIETVSLVFIVTLMAVSDAGQQVPVTPGSGSMAFWLTVVFALAGFESATFLGSEARRPYVTVTRAVLWTPILCGVLFLVAGWAALTGRADILVDIYLHGTSAHTSGLLVALVQLALACSWLASSMASTNAASRLLFTMGLDRVLPRTLATVSGRFRTPVAGVGAAMALAATATAVLLSGADTVLLAPVQAASRVGLITGYALIAVAAVWFLRRIGELTPALVVCGTLTAAGLLCALVAQLVLSVGRHDAAAPVALALLLAGVAAWPWLLRRYCSRGLDGMGVFDRADSGDVLPGAAAYGPDASGALVLVAGRSDDPGGSVEGAGDGLR
ncbi:APC family permease [Gordonia sp. VNK21]|uniref:APC family permease n=1 Tax=Gordonia sp. VNK21 TaxID=3382483 RepID=UPI0038D4B99E